MRDPLGAFCSDPAFRIPGALSGPLSGLVFAAKDVFDIAGFRTGAGNPDWLHSHPPAQATASAVQHLLDAGATLLGKTVTDELTYSLNGENVHFGTPENPNAPGRVSGGSSSGSASAVAGGLVDFALGTDTGGSVRLPASNCGIYGFRPSHGRIASDGVVPLAPSFDTVGWFARNAGLLSLVGKALLGNISESSGRPRLLLAADAFELVDKTCRPALDAAAGCISRAFGPAVDIELFSGRPEAWMDAFRLLQGAEAWACHGGWIRDHQPRFAPDVRGRFEWAATIIPEDLSQPRRIRSEIMAYLDELLACDGVLCIPSSPSIALPVDTAGPALEDFRYRALSLFCVAGLAGLPQISLPLASFDSCPIGISLIGPRDSDLQLLSLAVEISNFEA